MNEQENRIRCNMYLDKENVEIIKEFIQGAGLSFSSYIDLLVCSVAEDIEDIFIKIPPKKIIKTKKNKSIDKMRCNMYLDKRSAAIVKEAVKKAKRTFSGYINWLIGKTAERIQTYYSTQKKQNLTKEKGGKVYFNIWQIHKILKLIESNSNPIFLTDDQLEENTYGTKPFNYSETYEEVEQKTEIKKNKN